MDKNTTACPPNSFSYNTTFCSCNPGFYFSNGDNSNCRQFGPGNWSVGSGLNAGSQPLFLTTIFSLDNSLKRITSSQAVLLETTLVVLIGWLIFCFAMRIGKIDQGGKSRVFKVRRWIGQLDFFFDTQHWTEENKPVIRRKTEMGGTFSVASWILFVGLLSALLYQVFTKRTVEVHRVKPANTPDLLSFRNDLLFNITTISSMTCSNLIPPQTLITGTPGFIDFRTYPLTQFVTYNCTNTSLGPTITLKCENCQIPRRNHFISWQFFDLPNYPATAVAFQFNLTSSDHVENKYVSFVSGAVSSSGADLDKNTNKTFRGTETNVLKIQLFPEEYTNLGDLKIIQPLFNDFIPGSYLTDVKDLFASLENSRDGLVNTTLFISYQSDYIVQIDKEQAFGPVSILANIGGLCAICFIIFFYLLSLCESRIPKLRHEHLRIHDIITRRRANKNWDKVRKFVMYTWGLSNLDPTDKSGKIPEKSMIESIQEIGALRKKTPSSKRGPLYLEKSNKPSTQVDKGDIDIESIV